MPCVSFYDMKYALVNHLDSVCEKKRLRQRVPKVCVGGCSMACQCCGAR